jgi:hypothetical protein
MPHWLHRDAPAALLAPHVTHSHAGADFLADLRMIPMPKMTSTAATIIAMIENPMSFSPYWRKPKAMSASYEYLVSIRK